MSGAWERENHTAASNTNHYYVPDVRDAPWGFVFQRSSKVVSRFRMLTLRIFAGEDVDLVSKDSVAGEGNHGPCSGTDSGYI